MHRLLVDTSWLESDCPELPKAAARHLKVLRPEVGEPIELFDGQGHWREYKVETAMTIKSESTQAIQFAPRPRPLTLFACITKGSRWDWTIEKAVELGVTRIVPVISARTIVRLDPKERTAKCERWQRIVEEAVRQSDGKWLPELVEAVDFRDSLELVKATKCLIGALTNPPSPPISEYAKAGDAVYIGPEGDFTAEELAALMEIAKPVSFGSTILRAETAAIFALSVILAAHSAASDSNANS